MDFNKIGIVLSHEYSIRVKKKSFILTTLLTPILMGLLICVPVMMAFIGGDDVQKVKVVDESGVIAPFFESTDKVEYIMAGEGEQLELLKDSFFATDLYAVVGISPLDEKGEVSVVTYSSEPLNMELKQSISRTVNKVIKDRKLMSYNIENLDRIMEEVKTDIPINAMTLSESGDEKEDSVEIYMIISYVMSLLIYVFVFMFGSMVMRSVIEEKTSRVVEVIVSSVKSVELMMGKILGVALVALTQFFIWIALTLIITVGATSVVSGKIVEKAGGMDAVMQQMAASGIDIKAGGSVDIATLLEFTGENGENAGTAQVIRQLGEVNWGYIIFCFVVYFILGYLLYAAMFAAIGAAVDNEADTSQLQLPVTIPLIAGLFIMVHAFEHPSSDLSFWASVIPFTSPMVMLARVPFGIVPGWELALSMGLLFITFIGIAYVSAKIYKVGILTYGKKSSFKDLIKWARQKN